MSAHSTQPTDAPSSLNDHDSDVIATPEGDNEYAPDQPLVPSAPAPERPRGDDPHSIEPLYPALG